MPKNLNYFISASIPNKKAHTIQILKMCDALSRFYKVNLICKNIKKESIKDNFNLKNNFQIININIFKIKIINLLYKIYCLFIYKFRKDDILYTRDVHYAFFGLLFYKDIYLELHQSYLEKKVLSYFLLKVLFKTKKIKIIFISNELYKIYKLSFDEPVNFKIAHDAADDFFHKKIKKFKLNPKRIAVGYCGHLYRGRGIELLIKLAKAKKDINFNILGGFISDKEKILSNKKLPKNIFFSPHVNYKMTSRFLLSNDILIAPYQKKLGGVGDIDTAKYMSPLKIFEYMSSRKAIISSNHKVLKEILRNRRNSLLCDPDNFYDWLKALNKLENKKFREYLALNAYKDFKNYYTWNKRVEKILSTNEKVRKN